MQNSIGDVIMADELIPGASDVINFTGIFDVGMTVFYWSVIVLFVIGIILLIFYLFSFKHTVIIKEKFGEATPYKAPGDLVLEGKKTVDVATKLAQLNNQPKKQVRIIPYLGSVHKGKLTQKKGVNKLKLLFKKGNFKIPDQIFQAITKKGKKFIELTKISEHIYAPTVLVDEEKGLTQYVYDEGYFDWVVRDLEGDNLKYNKMGFWDKYGTPVIMLGTLGICFLLIVVTLRHSEALVATASKAASAASQAFNEAAQAWADSISQQQVK